MGTVYTNAGFEGGLGPVTQVSGVVTAVGTQGGVQPESGAGMLRVERGGASYGAAQYALSSQTTGVVTVSFYDDSSAMDTSLWITVTDGLNVNAYDPSTNPDGQRNSVAVLLRPTGGSVHPPATRYLLRTDQNYDGSEQTYYDTGVSRTTGWHTAQIFVTPSGSFARLDRMSLIQLSVNPLLTGFRSVFLATTDGGSQKYFDGLRVTSLPDLPAQIVDVLDTYVDTYGSTDYSALLSCACSGGGNARTPILHLATGYWLRYLSSCDSGLPDADLDRAIAALTDFVSTYPCWQEEWTSAAFAEYAAMTAWLLWDKLPPSLQTDIHNMVLTEAGYFSTSCTGEGYVHCPYISYNSGDSKAEENAWTASFYALAARMFASDPDASTWDARARTAGFHAITTGESYGGYTTQTVNDDPAAVDYLLVNNHGLNPSPNSFYSGATLQLLDAARWPYVLSGASPPDAQLAHGFAAALQRYFNNELDLASYTFVHQNANPLWDMDGAWLFPFAQGAAVSGEPRYDLLERDLVDHKYRAMFEWFTDSYLYEDPGNTAVLPCPSGTLDAARRNGRVQWYWVQGSLLWHLSPSLGPVTAP